MDIKYRVSKLIESKENNVDEWLEFLDQVKSKCDTDILIEIYTTALNHVPKQPVTKGYKKILIGLANLLSKESPDAAEKLFETARTIDNDCAVVCVYYAQFKCWQHNKDAAQRIIKDAKCDGRTPKILLKIAYQNCRSDKKDLLDGVADPWDETLFDATDTLTFTEEKPRKNSKSPTRTGARIISSSSSSSLLSSGKVKGPVRHLSRAHTDSGMKVYRRKLSSSTLHEIQSKTAAKDLFNFATPNQENPLSKTKEAVKTSSKPSLSPFQKFNVKLSGDDSMFSFEKDSPFTEKSFSDKSMYGLSMQSTTFVDENISSTQFNSIKDNVLNRKPLTEIQNTSDICNLSFDNQIKYSTDIDRSYTNNSVIDSSLEYSVFQNENITGLVNNRKQKLKNDYCTNKRSEKVNFHMHRFEPQQKLNLNVFSPNESNSQDHGTRNEITELMAKQLKTEKNKSEVVLNVGNNESSFDNNGEMFAFQKNTANNETKELLFNEEKLILDSGTIKPPFDHEKTILEVEPKDKSIFPRSKLCANDEAEMLYFTEKQTNLKNLENFENKMDKVIPSHEENEFSKRNENGLFTQDDERGGYEKHLTHFEEMQNFPIIARESSKTVLKNYNTQQIDENRLNFTQNVQLSRKDLQLQPIKSENEVTIFNTEKSDMNISMESLNSTNSSNNTVVQPLMQNNQDTYIKTARSENENPVVNTSASTKCDVKVLHCNYQGNTNDDVLHCNYQSNTNDANKAEQNLPVSIEKAIGEIKSHDLIAQGMEILKENESSPMEAPKINKYFTVKGRKYGQIKCIGRGGSCKVFEVVDEQGNIFALKRVKLAGCEDFIIKTYINEIQWLERLKSHNCIIKIIEWEEKGSVLLIVLEKGDNDLAQVMKSPGNLSLSKIKKYWKQMLTAVDVIHNAGIVHTDLKPANFLFVGDTLKLIDFGIASRIQDNKTSVTREYQMGTISYMAPETIKYEMSLDSKDSGRVSKKSDVWSLGCILYAMFFKKTPYQHIRHSDLKMKAIQDGQPINYDGINDPIVLDCLKGCLTYSKVDRYSIAQLLKHEFVLEN